jgi:hypothetical protein
MIRNDWATLFSCTKRQLLLLPCCGLRAAAAFCSLTKALLQQLQQQFFYRSRTAKKQKVETEDYRWVAGDSTDAAGDNGQQVCDRAA